MGISHTSHERPFGAEAFAYVPAIQQRKFDAKAHEKRRVIIARDVKFKDTAKERSLCIIVTPTVRNHKAFVKDENKSSQEDDGSGTSSEFTPAEHELNYPHLRKLEDTPTDVEFEMEVESIEQTRKHKQDDLDNTLQISLCDRRHLKKPKRYCEACSVFVYKPMSHRDAMLGRDKAAQSRTNRHQLEKEIFIEIRVGLDIPERSRKACRQRKALYGLKQAYRC
ncbi:hypothetical protein TKK_0013765 [Trichogramma kaykai]